MEPYRRAILRQRVRARLAAERRDAELAEVLGHDPQTIDNSTAMTFEERERRFNAALDADLRRHREIIAAEVRRAVERGRRDEARLRAVVLVAALAFAAALLAMLTLI